MAAIRAGVRTSIMARTLDDEAVALLQGPRATFYVPTLYTSAAVLGEPLVWRGARRRSSALRRDPRGSKKAGFRRALAERPADRLRGPTRR